jgi:hypothetical protein
MENNSISRTSSICTHEAIIIGSFSGGESENNFQITPKHAESENSTVKSGIMNNQKEFEGNSIKQKILKLFCFK